MFRCEAARSFTPLPLRNFVANTACSILINIDSGWTVKYIFSLRIIIVINERKNSIRYEGRWVQGVRGVLSKLLVGMCILNLEACTRPKSVIFHTLFSDLSKKLIPHFKNLGCSRILLISNKLDSLTYSTNNSLQCAKGSGFKNVFNRKKKCTSEYTWLFRIVEVLQLLT